MDHRKTNFWEPCWACRVKADQYRCCVVTETQEVLVLLNPFPLTAGHALVVPRQHLQNVYELPDALAGPILSTAAQVARAAKRAFSADGVTLRQNNDAASDQHLFHFHLHVIPRFEGDLDKFNAKPQLASTAELGAMAARLRSAMIEEESNSSSADVPKT